MTGSTRRTVLATGAALSVTAPAAATAVEGALPWTPNAASPAAAVQPGGWKFFTPEEASLVDAILARLIPTDDLGPGAKDSGGTVFIDRQLAGPYGSNDGLYMQGPFPDDPLPQQGMQSPVPPRDQYRKGLAALAAYCAGRFNGRGFAQLSADEQDGVLAGLEKGEAKLAGVDGRAFFALVLTNTQEGFFADPTYGGNQGMAGWKLIGFPGTRYDYRDAIARPNEGYALPPVGLQGRPEWGGKP
jgi:gluconate 2-dehydrogenase gamma chain